MKICTVRIERRLLRYRSPIPTAHGPVGDRWTVLLALEDEDGHTGLGEAAPLAGFTPDTVDDAEAALHRWASDDSNGGLPDGSPTARAAVDSALLDLAARVAGTSVHRLLAPDSPDRGRSGHGIHPRRRGRLGRRGGSLRPCHDQGQGRRGWDRC